MQYNNIATGREPVGEGNRLITDWAEMPLASSILARPIHAE